MTRSAEGTGRNLEQAIENALFELKAPREDVDIKIISEGGLFKKAKVVVSISEDVIEKYEAREKNKEDLKNEIEKEEKEQEKLEKKQEKEAKKEEKKAQKEAEKQDKKEEQQQQAKEVRERISAKQFIEGLLKAFNKEAETEESETDDVIKLNIKGENLSELIGYRGETLFALSYLMSNICKRETKKQVLDVCSYREKREESLKRLAYRMAGKVAKTGRYAKLEPMDASERRIIHLALQDNEKVTTMSKGTEPKRYLIIFPREYKD